MKTNSQNSTAQHAIGTGETMSSGTPLIVHVGCSGLHPTSPTKAGKYSCLLCWRRGSAGWVVGWRRNHWYTIMPSHGSLLQLFDSWESLASDRLYPEVLDEVVEWSMRPSSKQTTDTLERLGARQLFQIVALKEIVKAVRSLRCASNSYSRNVCLGRPAADGLSMRLPLTLSFSNVRRW